MDLNQKFQVKLAPLDGVVQQQQTKGKSSTDRRRLKGGCTKLMYACQQGLTDTIVKEVRSQVNINPINPLHFRELSIILNRKYLSVN